MSSDWTSFASFCLAKTLDTGQTIAKALGASPALVSPKNPPAPGPDAKPQTPITGRLYHSAKKTAENFGDPASAAFLAGDEYLAKTIDAMFNLISAPRGFLPYWTSLPGQVAFPVKNAQTSNKIPAAVCRRPTKRNGGKSTMAYLMAV